MVVEESLEGQKDLVFQAFLNDPFVRISIDKAWKMFNKMLEYVKISFCKKE